MLGSGSRCLDPVRAACSYIFGGGFFCYVFHKHHFVDMKPTRKHFSLQIMKLCIFSHLSRVGSGDSSLASPATCQGLLEESRGELRDSPSSVSKVCPGLLPVRRTQNTSAGRLPGGILTKYTNHLIWLLDVELPTAEPVVSMGHATPPPPLPQGGK